MTRKVIVWVLLAFFVLILLGMPLAFAAGLAALISLIADKTPLLLVPQAMSESVDSFAYVAVPLFMLAGSLMNIGGITTRIFNFASDLVGHIKGSLGHVNVIGSMIFAGMSGSAMADVGGLGVIEIKAMRDAGYDDDFTIGITLASATCGPIIPPSIPFVIFGTVIGVSVGRLFLAGFLPGLLIGLALMIMVYFMAQRRDYPIRKRATLRGLAHSFAGAFLALMTPVILIGGMVFGIFTPTEAAAVTVLYALILGIVLYREVKFKDIVDMCVDVVVTTGTSMFVLTTAFLFVWILTVGHIPQSISAAIAASNMSRFTFLLVVNLFLLFLGCFLTITPAVVLVAPILMPVALKFGIDPVHFGVMFVLNMMIGLLTPPVGASLFIVSKVAKISVMDAFRTVLPFLIPLLIVQLLITYVPQITMLIPNLLMGRLIR